MRNGKEEMRIHFELIVSFVDRNKDLDIALAVGVTGLCVVLRITLKFSELHITLARDWHIDEQKDTLYRKYAEAEHTCARFEIVRS